MAGSNSIVPNQINAKISWFEQHITPWTDNSTAIGTTAGAVTDLQTKTQAARDAYNAQQEAQGIAMAATNTLRMAVEAMSTAGADIIKSIRTKAATAGDSVYSLAVIPVPATPSPIGELSKPTDFTVELSETGSLKLKWKCAQPAGATGTIYQVYRRIGVDGTFTYLGGAGKKEFIDQTLPAGSAQVTYQIQAARSSGTGPWAQFNVNFGMGSGGTMTASVSEGTPVKIAA